MGGSQAAVRAKLRRLREKRIIATPVRSFHVLVPPEYRLYGCPPAEHFIDALMRSWGEPYYFGMLTAAERHGAAHQRPQTCQVVLRRNHAPIHCGLVRIVFIARADMERMPTVTIHTPVGDLPYSTPEVTALELVGRLRHAGGLNNAATVLTELGESLDGDKLLAAAQLSPISWSQRLGYLLDLVGWEEIAAAILPFVRERAKSFALLGRQRRISLERRSTKWKLIINTDVAPDL